MRAYDGRVTDIDESASDGATSPHEPVPASDPANAEPPPPTPDEAPPTTSSPGERRLARPPSDRYREAEAATSAAETEAAVDPAASVARGVALASAVAISGAAAIVFLGGVLSFTEVLLVVAGFTGGGVGISLRWGAGDRLAGRRRVAIALALALVAVALGQLGLWQYGRTEGGVLGPLDYLGQVYGPLVLVEFAAAGVLAWLAAR
jgi:hypothetical protein